MPRPKKDYVALNVKLDRELHEQFKAYADELGQTKTTALERILRKHLSEHFENNGEVKTKDAVRES